jgi:hypothetical protein
MILQQEYAVEIKATPKPRISIDIVDKIPVAVPARKNTCTGSGRV